MISLRFSLRKSRLSSRIVSKAVCCISFIIKADNDNVPSGWPSTAVMRPLSAGRDNPVIPEVFITTCWGCKKRVPNLKGHYCDPCEAGRRTKWVTTDTLTSALPLYILNLKTLI